MGLTERKEREHAKMRRAILDAARHLFIEGGYANVPIRRVAMHIEYSPAALYRYFKTKDEIFGALAEEGFRLLMSRETLPSSPPDAPPLERLKHFFWGVYDFSKLHPEYFYLIFLDRSAPRLQPGSDSMRVVAKMYAHVAKLVDDCIAAGDLAPGLHGYDVYNVLVSGMHGVAALSVCDRLPAGSNPDGLAHAVLDVAIAGLKGPGLHGVTTGDRCVTRKARAGRPGPPPADGLRPVAARVSLRRVRPPRRKPSA
jgi:AcrR family transcriptional regulator